jgi:dipeptidyl aminopeptidase/acylaminoacyl peptidase
VSSYSAPARGTGARSSFDEEVLMLQRAMVAFTVMVIGLPAWGAPVPLIDREAFFGDPEISRAQLSPDGRYIAFMKPLNGTRNIWVKGTAEPFSAARPITADTKRPIPGYFWTWDGKYILYEQDQGGDENYNVYAVNPKDKPSAGAKVPLARNLTGVKGVRTAIYDLPKTDPDVVYIGLNDRDKAWHDLYQVKISTGKRTLVRKNTDRIGSWQFDHQGVLRLAVRSAENGDTEILRVEAKATTKIYACNVLESCGPIQFHKDNRRVYLEDNRGDAVNLSRLALLDIATGKLEVVESDPQRRVDFGHAMFSEGEELLGTFYTDDRERQYWKDQQYAADHVWLKKQLAGQEVAFGSRTRDERLYLVAAHADTEPGATYLFDRAQKKLTLQYRVYEKLDRAQLATTKPIRYRSSDRLEIPAYLTLPKGVPAKKLSLMVFPHGGPWSRDEWGYHPYWQFLANRGYAVLAPNFRGSAGYGKKFLDAGNGQWGERMQDDLTWGVKHLIAKGIADPKRVGIMGGSYGGYATLAGVAFTPDLYAAGVSLVGPSSLLTLLDSIPPYWEAGRKTMYRRMADPTTSEGKAKLARQSPLNSARKIKKPLMVVQGANDPRVKKAESDQIVVALRDRGFPVEYLVAPDEGHGFARPVNNQAFIAAAEKFLAAHLKGRYQAEMPAAIGKRLAEITVDPKTVVLAQKIDPTAVGALVLAGSPSPGKHRYRVTVTMGENTMKLERETEIKDQGGAWVVTDTAKTPMGEAVDVAVLERKTLSLMRRSVTQGPAKIELEVKGGKAVGKMNVGGKEKPVSVEVSGPLFADASGGTFCYAALPLKEGYATSFRNLDLMRQKVKVMRLKVVGTEKVTVPAGTYNAYKVEVTSSEGDQTTMVWVAKDARMPVKVIVSGSALGGATMTSELTK